MTLEPPPESSQVAPGSINVTEALETLPFLLSTLEKALAKEIEALDRAKRNLEIQKAIVTVENADAKNQRMLEAKIIADQRVQTCEDEVVAAKGKVAEARIDLSEAENAFCSARKLASLQNTLSPIRLSSRLLEAIRPHIS